MKITIKARPEDFLVTEIASVSFSPKGEFGVYRLKKTGWNTVELIRELSFKLNLPRELFAYGGRKDRHSQSTQYITVKSPKRLELKADKYSLEFLGFMNRPMGPDLIEKNKFSVIVRKLGPSEIKKCATEIGVINAIGYPNYFDDQRFGSFDCRQGFMAEKVLKAQFNGALKIYLTSVNPEDRKEERQRKKFIFDHWKDWRSCLSHSQTVREKEIFAFLVLKPTAFLEVLKNISREELSGQYSSYQAYLWNEVLRRMVAPAIPGPYKIYPGKAGDYIFYTQANQYLEDLIIPTPGAKAQMNDKHGEEIYRQVLEDKGIIQAVFNKLKLRQAFFKSSPRKANVKPDDLSFSVSDDEIYPGKKKLVLRFSLPRGSYATMLLKRLFS